MKNTILIFFVFCFQHALAQNLKDTEWSQVKVERKDGSRIIDHQRIELSKTKYAFKETTVSIIVNNVYLSELPYTINNNTLLIGEFIKYHIDKLDQENLVLTEIPNREKLDDKINRFTFLNKSNLFDNLKENGKIKIIGDSLILCDNQFSPNFNGNFTNLLTQEFKSHTENKAIYGFIILNYIGVQENIQFEENKSFSPNEIQKIKQIIQTTKEHWILPKTPAGYKFKIPFRIAFSYIKPMSGVHFDYATSEDNQDINKSITHKEIVEADKYFNRGNELIQKENYDKAISQFKSCIEIDSKYTDAYYNLASCYQKLGNNNMACETWLKLKNMGQKQGQLLFDENCK